VFWGSNNFGLSWIEGPTTDAYVMFGLVQSNGTYVGQNVWLQQGEVDRPVVGRFGSNDWWVVWRSFGPYRVILEGQVPPPFQAGPATPVVLSVDVGPRGEPIAFDAAAAADEFGLLYDSADAGFFPFRYDDDFSDTGGWPLLDAVGSNPVVASTSDGYARAWVTTTGIAVERSVQGASSSACQNANIEFGSSNSADDGVAIVATTTGLAALVTRAASDEVGFFTLDNDCQVVRGPLTVSGAATSPTLPRLAFGATGFAAVWREQPTTNTRQGLIRTFSSDLCD
jgi:hypothetical protein